MASTEDYFGAGHPLARAAGARCQQLDHPAEGPARRRRLLRVLGDRHP